MVMVQQKNRLATYMQDKDQRNADTIKWTNKMMLAMGLDIPVSTNMPVNDFLIGADIARAFLAQVFCRLSFFFLLFLVFMFIVPV